MATSKQTDQGPPHQESLDEDPESARSILREGFLWVLPVALLILLGAVALIMTFAG